MIGYGAMLLEGMVAVVSLCCVMMLTREQAATIKEPSFIYARGLASSLGVMRIRESVALTFGMLAFTTFVYDTLDVCTRLGRYVIQELTGWQDRRGRWLGTALTAGVPVYFVLKGATDPVTAAPVPVWRTFWALFGASNQLLAALTLLGVTVWLWRTRRAPWVWFVTGIPLHRQIGGSWQYVGGGASGRQGSLRFLTFGIGQRNSGQIEFAFECPLTQGAVQSFKVGEAFLVSRSERFYLFNDVGELGL